jgi:hypothetical protein
MAEEGEFQLRQRPLFQVLVDSDLEDKREIRVEGEGRDIRHNKFTVSLKRSVVSLDSVAAGSGQTWTWLLLLRYLSHSYIT